MANLGWIQIHRKIRECVIWDSDEPFDRRSAWIDLIMLVNHEDKETVFDGEVVVVKKGQRITSVRILADRWHWGNEKTLKFLKLLEEQNMITREATNRRTLITVVNYELYQCGANTDRTETEQQQNGNRTQTERRPSTNNNYNNYNNDNNDNNEEQINTINGAALPNPFDQVKQEQAKAAGKKARKEQKGTLEELEDSMSRSSASDELKEELRKWWRWRRYDKKIPMGSLAIRNTVAESSQSEVVYGTELTIACFERSMTNDYQGVFFNEKAMRATVKDLKEQGATITYGKGGQPKIDWSSL